MAEGASALQLVLGGDPTLYSIVALSLGANDAKGHSTKSLRDSPLKRGA
jgi:hypothetical protein